MFANASLIHGSEELGSFYEEEKEMGYNSSIVLGVQCSTTNAQSTGLNVSTNGVNNRYSKGGFLDDMALDIMARTAPINEFISPSFRLDTNYED